MVCLIIVKPLFCKDCKNRNDWGNCNVPWKELKGKVFDPVTGRKITTAADCKEMRLFDCYCGWKANWFETKPDIEYACKGPENCVVKENFPFRCYECPDLIKGEL